MNIRFLTIDTFVREFNTGRVLYDPTFQRREVWLKDHQWSFLESVSKGWVFGNIVILDIDACRVHCKALRDEAGESYFAKAGAAGYKYISLDGQNRSKALEKFYENKLQITGQFVDADGETHNIKNKHFKDLPQRLKDHFKSGSSIPVRVVSSITRLEAAQIFEDLQRGCPLNDQEKRNAKQTPMADTVRGLSERYNPLMTRCLSEKKLNRMQDDEMIAKTLMMLVNNYRSPETGKAEGQIWDLNSRAINKFYDLGKDIIKLLDPCGPYIEKEFRRALEILEIVNGVIINQGEYTVGKKLVPKRQYWATVHAATHVWDNGSEIYDYKKFFSKLLKTDQKLFIDAEQAYVAARSKLVAQGKDPDKIYRDNYYHRQCQLPHQAAARLAREKALIEEIKRTPHLWADCVRQRLDVAA